MEKSHKFKDDPSIPEFVKSTIYRADGNGYAVGVIFGAMSSTDIADEIKSTKQVNQQHGGTSKDITQAGLLGVESKFPARGATASTTERQFFRDGKRITLQFSLNKTGDANSAALHRERFFNSFKLK